MFVVEHTSGSLYQPAICVLPSTRKQKLKYTQHGFITLHSVIRVPYWCFISRVVVCHILSCQIKKRQSVSLIPVRQMCCHKTDTIVFYIRWSAVQLMFWDICFLWVSWVPNPLEWVSLKQQIDPFRMYFDLIGFLHIKFLISQATLDIY